MVDLFFKKKNNNIFRVLIESFHRDISNFYMHKPVYDISVLVASANSADAQESLRICAHLSVKAFAARMNTAWI